MSTGGPIISNTISLTDHNNRNYLAIASDLLVTTTSTSHANDVIAAVFEDRSVSPAGPPAFFVFAIVGVEVKSNLRNAVCTRQKYS